jgi:cytochrome c-type biogenesis protein CcmH
MIGGIVLIALCVWWLGRALKRPVTEDEQRARHEQFVMTRDRLLLELDQLEAARDNDEIDVTLAQQESLRLETELAQVLRKLEQDEGVTTSAAAPHSLRITVASLLALWLPVSAGVLYLAAQSEELLWLAGFARQEQSLPSNHPRQASQAPATTAGAGAGQQSSGQGQFPPQVMEMVARLEQRLQQNPEDGAGWKRLGRSYMVLGRYREAVSAYTSAAELLPGDRDIQQALWQLAAIAAAGNKHPAMPEGTREQIVALERRVGEQPEDAQAWAGLAMAYDRIGRTRDAQRAWSEAHKQAPRDTDILAAYASHVFTSNPRDPQGEALALYRKLHELAPKHPDGLWFLGLAAYSEGNIARTRALWQELLEVLPPDSEAHQSVSEALAGVERLFNTPK